MFAVMLVMSVGEVVSGVWDVWPPLLMVRIPSPNLLDLTYLHNFSMTDRLVAITVCGGGDEALLWRLGVRSFLHDAGFVGLVLGICWHFGASSVS